MNLPFNSLYFIVLLSTFSTLLIFILYFNYKKTKSIEMNRLNYLFLALDKEKLVANKLNSVDLEISQIEKQTQLKINKVNTGVLNMHFSLTEIFND